MVFDEGHRGVSEGKVVRSLTEEFVATEQLPVWVSTYGDASRTEVTSISDECGELKVRVSSGEGGIRFPSSDVDAFREIRVGCALRLNLGSSENQLAVGFSSPGSLYQSPGAALVTQAKTDNTATVQYTENGTTVATSANFDVVRGPLIVETRLRSYERGFTVAMGSGDDVVYEDAGAAISSIRRRLR